MTSNQKIGIFYATISKRTERVAQQIGKSLHVSSNHIYNIIDLDTPQIIQAYPFLVFGTPTYGKGDLHYLWKEFLPAIVEQNMTNQQVAVFCLGDKKHHTATFAGELIKMYNQLNSTDCEVIGQCDAGNYDFEASPSVIEGNLFPGLVLDEISESHLTQERIDTWI